MTGELFSLLKQHSILSDLLVGTVEDNDAFRAGANKGIFDDGLTADLFTIRADVLLGQSKREDAPSFASGLLIGTDVRIGLKYPTASQIVVMGRPDLTRLYAAAIEVAGRGAIELDGEQSFLEGVAELAKRI
jgi:2-dehydro-3-deoxygalactonokinase